MGSKTTVKNEVPDATPEELALLTTSNELLKRYAQELGYSIEEKRTPAAQMPRALEIKSEIDRIRSEIDADTAIRNRAPANPLEHNQSVEADARIRTYENQLRDLNKQYDDYIANTPDDVQVSTRSTYNTQTEREYQAAQEIKNQFGEDSPEYREAQQKYKASIKEYEDNKIAQEADANEINRLVADRAKRFLSGDLAINDSEKQFISDILGPIKDAGINAIDYLTQEVDRGEKSFTEALGSLKERINQTGMDVGDALVALDTRVKQTGEDLNKALDQEISIGKELLSMGIEDFTSAQRLRISQNAARLGRSDTDPLFQRELQDLATREIQRGSLQLSQYAAGQRLGIAERTGAGLENSQQQRVALADQQGQRLEGVEATDLQLRNQLAQQRLGIAGQRGAQEIELANQAGNLRSQLSVGLPPTLIASGINAGNYQQALDNLKQQNLAAASQLPLNQYGVQQRERLAESTQTTTKSGGIGGWIGGALGLGLQGLGAYFGAPAPRSGSTLPQ